MKKQDIVSRLSAMLEIAKAPEIKEQISELIAELQTSKETDKGKLTYFVKIQEQVLDPAVKYPRQMLECYKILQETEQTEFTLQDIQKLMGESAERLNTRQDPFRIYAFYQKRMADEGWIEREKERI